MTSARLALLLAPLALALAALTACGAAPEPAPAPAPAPVRAPAPSSEPAPQASAAPVPTAAPQASAAPAPAAPAAPATPCPEGMALIPGGSYSFGATKKDKAMVTVAPFCIDVNETTAAAYEACVKTGKCDTSKLTVCDPSTYGKDASGKMPMVCVDFDQADKYCKGVDKRLPSTEEWEWAARGASASASRPWGEGDVAGKICWRRDKPCEIGAFPQGDSPQGVKDLLGGVFEWTTTKNDGTTSNRTVRGGSWKDYAADLFDPARHGIFKSSYRCGFGGIRCAMPVPEGKAAPKP
jgi:sulfatase modifying factor 1